MWETFAKMIGVPLRAAEDAIHSERATKATLLRRGLLLAGASALPVLAMGNLFSDVDVYRGYKRIWVGPGKPWVGGVFNVPVLIEGDTHLTLTGGLFTQGVRVRAPVAAISCMHLVGQLPREEVAMKLDFTDPGGVVSGCTFDLKTFTRGDAIAIG